MPDRVYLDANVLLRLLLQDEPRQAEAAANFLRESADSGRKPWLGPVTLAEVVFVLGGAVYRFERSRIASAVQAILALPIAIEEREIVERALDIYRDEHPDWADAYLAACAIVRASGRIVTFDRQLSRLAGLSATQP